MIPRFVPRNHPQQVATRGALDSVDDRVTPEAMFREIDAEFRFTLDVAASPDNARCRRFFTRDQDGLSQSWAGETVWCNPPYSNIGAWVKKAIDEVRGGCRGVVLLIPGNRCEQAFWQDLVEPVRDRGLGITTRFLRGRRHFDLPGKMVRRKEARPPFGLVLVIVEPRGKED